MTSGRTQFKKIITFLVAVFTLYVYQSVSMAKAGNAGGLSWASPTEWVVKDAARMRVATYVIPATTGDSEDGECAVYFFGPGQGGSVRANIRRWLGQFRTSGGGPVDDLAQVDTLAIGDVEVTLLRVSGTYLFKPAPFAPKVTPKPGYRMLAAIAQGPTGPVFFKVTAPEKTAKNAEAAFQKMLQSLTK